MVNPHMGVSKNSGTPKWMVYFMENPIKHGMIWGFSQLFLETPILKIGSTRFAAHKTASWSHLSAKHTFHCLSIFVSRPPKVDVWNSNSN